MSRAWIENTSRRFRPENGPLIMALALSSRSESSHDSPMSLSVGSPLPSRRYRPSPPQSRDWINGLNFRGSRTIAGCTMDRTSIPRIAFSGPRVEPPAGRSGHVPGAVLNPAFAGLDERGFGIEQVQAQALGLQHLVAEFFERREY